MVTKEICETPEIVVGRAAVGLNVINAVILIQIYHC